MAEIAVDASKKALAAAGREGAEVDAVYCAAANMQRAYPAMACEIQAALGAGGYGFDMNVACSSATFGIEQAANAVQCGTARAVLVVNPEITSAHLAWRDRDCHFIFGDVCTAVLVERADTAAPGSWEILGTRLATKYSNNIRNNFGFLNRCELPPRDPDELLFVQDGRQVFREVIPIVSALITRGLGELGIEVSAIKRFWLHQANLSMNELILKRVLGRAANENEAPIVLDEYANTSSAGSVIAFHKHHEGFAKGDLGVLCAFGSGYSAGIAVLRKL